MYRDPSYAQPVDTLTPFVRLAAGSAGVPELRFAPDIPAKQLQGCLSFAQVAPHEQPVALVDTTVLQLGKGGVLVALAEQLDVPVRFIGIGEQAADMDVFDAGEFATALLGSAAQPPESR